jgi:general stress protein CsbA
MISITRSRWVGLVSQLLPLIFIGSSTSKYMRFSSWIKLGMISSASVVGSNR